MSKSLFNISFEGKGGCPSKSLLSIQTEDDETPQFRSIEEYRNSSTVTEIVGGGTVTDDGIPDPLEINNLIVNDVLQANNIEVADQLSIGSLTISGSSLINDGVLDATDVNNNLAANNIIFTSSIGPIIKTTIPTTSSTMITAPNGNAGVLYYDGSVIRGVTDPPMAGDILTYDGTEPIWVAGVGATVTLNDSGTGIGLTNDGTGPTLSIKSVIGGSNINITDNGPDITISATSLSSQTFITFADETGTLPNSYMINAGTGISITDLGNDIFITNIDGGSSVSLSSAGGTSLVADGTGPTLSNKGLIGGTDISLTSTPTTITITNDSPASSLTLGSAGGISLVSDGIGPIISTKGLDAGANFTIIDNGSFLTLSAIAGVGSFTITNDGIPLDGMSQLETTNIWDMEGSLFYDHPSEPNQLRVLALDSDTGVLATTLFETPHTKINFGSNTTTNITAEYTISFASDGCTVSNTGLNERIAFISCSFSDITESLRCCCISNRFDITDSIECGAIGFTSTITNCNNSVSFISGDIQNSNNSFCFGQLSSDIGTAGAVPNFCNRCVVIGQGRIGSTPATTACIDCAVIGDDRIDSSTRCSCINIEGRILDSIDSYVFSNRDGATTVVIENCDRCIMCANNESSIGSAITTPLDSAIISSSLSSLLGTRQSIISCDTCSIEESPIDCTVISSRNCEIREPSGAGIRWSALISCDELFFNNTSGTISECMAISCSGANITGRLEANASDSVFIASELVNVGVLTRSTVIATYQDTGVLVRTLENVGLGAIISCSNDVRISSALGSSQVMAISCDGIAGTNIQNATRVAFLALQDCSTSAFDTCEECSIIASTTCTMRRTINGFIGGSNSCDMFRTEMCSILSSDTCDMGNSGFNTTLSTIIFSDGCNMGTSGGFAVVRSSIMNSDTCDMLTGVASCDINSSATCEINRAETSGILCSNTCIISDVAVPTLSTNSAIIGSITCNVASVVVDCDSCVIVNSIDSDIGDTINCTFSTIIVSDDVQIRGSNYASIIASEITTEIDGADYAVILGSDTLCSILSDNSCIMASNNSTIDSTLSNNMILSTRSSDITGTSTNCFITSSAISAIGVDIENSSQSVIASCSSGVGSTTIIDSSNSMIVASADASIEPVIGSSQTQNQCFIASAVIPRISSSGTTLGAGGATDTCSFIASNIGLSPNIEGASKFLAAVYNGDARDVITSCIIACGAYDCSNMGTGPVATGTAGNDACIACQATTGFNHDWTGIENSIMMASSLGGGSKVPRVSNTFVGADTATLQWEFDSSAGTISANGAISAFTPLPGLAKMLENADNIPIPYGRLVKIVSGKKVRLCKTGEQANYVTRPYNACSFVTGESPFKWQGTHVRDIWGSILHKNPNTKSIPYNRRKDRPNEWSTCEWSGIAPVLVDQTVIEEGYIISGDDGIGTYSAIPTRIYCIKIVNYLNEKPSHIELSYDDKKLFEKYNLAICVVGNGF